jgi:hypothetical protein
MPYDVDNDPSFRRFCAQGDRMLREKQQQPARADAPVAYQLPTSTREMLTWLDAFHPDRLQAVMAGRSEAEREAARQFLRQDRKERAKKKVASQ